MIDGKLVRVLSWYDNEWGFSNRMVDTAGAMAKLLRSGPLSSPPTCRAKGRETSGRGWMTAQAGGESISRPSTISATSPAKRVLVRVDLNVPMNDGAVDR